MSGHIVPVKIYLAIFAILIVLTGVTVGVAFADLGLMNIVVALTIAVFRATLVILYFMHVRYESRLSWVFVGAGFFWLAILIVFTLSDVLTRDWLAVPVGWN